MRYAVVLTADVPPALLALLDGYLSPIGSSLYLLCDSADETGRFLSVEAIHASKAEKWKGRVPIFYILAIADLADSTGIGFVAPE